MKNRLVSMFVIAAIASIAFAGAARAQIIGIDFYNAGTTGDTPVSSSADVGPYASTGWHNAVDPSTTPGPGSVSLLDSTNASTTATFGFTQGGADLLGNGIYNSGYGAGGVDNSDLTPDQQLYSGWVSTTPVNHFDQEVVLQNIPYAQYSVYLLVYAGQYNNDVGSVQDFAGGTLGGAGTEYYFSNTGPYSTNIPSSSNDPFYVQALGTSYDSATSGADYVLYSGLSGADQTFDITNDGGNDTPDEQVLLSAIEIVNTTPAPAPEPATWAMGLCGLGMLLGLQKFRRRKA